MHPDVTVVIPTMGGRAYFRMALVSVMRQRGVNLEVLIVDGSRDGDETARLAAAQDARIRVIRRPGPGMAAKRNVGIDQAQGTWIAFLDDDDLWAPWKLETQLRLAQTADFVFGAAVVIDEHCNELMVLAPPENDAALYEN